MNSKDKILSNTVSNTSRFEETKDIWLPMNNNTRFLNRNTNEYQFQPIDHDFSVNSSESQINNSHLIQCPIPISNSQMNSKIVERPKQQQQHGLQMKRSSTINLDSTIRSYGLPRSMTSDHLANNSTNRLYYYPSVQDVLDALNRRAFDKESFV